MHFKLDLILMIAIEQQFEMRLEKPGSLGFVLWFNVSDEKDKRYGTTLCTVITDTSPPETIADPLQSGSDPLPKSVLSFADDLQARLCTAVETALKLLRWFRDDSCGHNTIGCVKRLAYSADGNHWRPLPTTVNVKIAAGIPRLKMSDKVCGGVAKFWLAGVDEPIAHELFREAAEQEAKNPRSSIVLGVAAAETGFKQLVGRLVPAAKWLVDEVPSPPLKKMLTEFLPILPTVILPNGMKPIVPKGLIEIVEKAVNLRNQVLHGKAPNLSSDTLHEILLAIHDCLYLFDCCNGHGWAWNRISLGTQQLIVQEASGNSSQTGQKALKQRR